MYKMLSLFLAVKIINILKIETWRKTILVLTDLRT